MTENFDKFVRDLQEEVIRDARTCYSDKVVELWLNPRNLGALENPDAHARVKGPCGDTMQIFLRVAEDRITQATFLTDGCGPSLAAGSIATQLAAGKTLKEAGTITHKRILDALGGLPQESEHCAVLAASTLATAISTYKSRRGDPSQAENPVTDASTSPVPASEDSTAS